MTSTPPVLMAAAAVAVAVLTGCAATTEPTATSVSGPVVFGTGDLPDTLPEDFPIPVDASIGTTMVDGDRNLTEVALQARGSTEQMVAYYERSLEAQGWDVPRSEAAGIGWEIDFARGEASGLIVIEEPEPNISRIVIEFAGPGG